MGLTCNDYMILQLAFDLTNITQVYYRGDFYLFILLFFFKSKLNFVRNCLTFDFAPNLWNRKDRKTISPILRVRFM